MMAKITVTYGKRRTSSRMLDEKRFRRYFLTSLGFPYSSIIPVLLAAITVHANHVPTGPTESAPSFPTISIQHSSPIITNRTPIIEEADFGLSIIAQLQQSHAPEAVRFRSPSQLLCPPLAEQPTLLDNMEYVEPPTKLSQHYSPAHTAQTRRYSTAAIGEEVSPQPRVTSYNLNRQCLAHTDGKAKAMLAATAPLKSTPHLTTPLLPNFTKSSSLAISADHEQSETAHRLKRNRGLNLAQSTSPELQKRTMHRGEKIEIMAKQLAPRRLHPNESDNLCRKVRKLAGSSPNRRPDHRQTGLDNAPRPHADGKNGSKTNQMEVFTYSKTPFETEKDFEDNLSDGLLSDCPTGASTPKSTRTSSRLPNCQENGDELSPFFGSGQDTFRPEQLASSLDQFITSTSKLASVEPTSDGHWVKKHPSPSKKALEDLEAAFAIYTTLKPLRGKDERDELATNPRRPLANANRNEARGPSREKRAVHTGSHNASSKCSYRTRYGLPCQSESRGCQDDDELR